MRHGSESFFIVGEGLVATEVGGRKGNEPDPVNVSDDAARAGPGSAGRG